MGDHIWIVRDPSGKVIGAGTRPVSAVCELGRAEQHNPAFLTLFGALERSYPDWVVRYEANGYTLTREQHPTGTAGAVTEAMHDAAFRAYADQRFTFGVFEMTAADEHRIREALRKAVDAAFAALAAATGRGEQSE